MLRKQPVAVFSEGARWRTGSAKDKFAADIGNSRRVLYLTIKK